MLRKEKNRLLSKGMSNIYLNVTIEKKWRSQNFDFQKICHQVSFGELQFTQVLLNFKLFIAT